MLPPRRCTEEKEKTPQLNWGANAQTTSRKLHPKLEVQFQSKLDLTRIIRCIAGRSDLAKAGTGVVARSGDCNHAIPTEIWSIEVRVVKDVENLGPELQPEPLAELHILEDGEIHPLERRSGNLVRRAAQSRHRAREGGARCWLAKRLGIIEEAQLAV